jgi:hypothetical protein
MPGEQELQLGDVEPARANPKRSRTEPRAPTAAQRTKRVWPGKPIDRKTPASLKRANSSPSGRTSEPINRPEVEPISPKRNLKSSNRRRPHTASQRTGRNGKKRDDAKGGSPDAHPNRFEASNRCPAPSDRSYANGGMRARGRSHPGVVGRTKGDANRPVQPAALMSAERRPAAAADTTPILEAHLSRTHWAGGAAGIP